MNATSQVVAEALGQIDPETQKILPNYAHVFTAVTNVNYFKVKTKDWQKAIEELEKRYPRRAKEKARP